MKLVELHLPSLKEETSDEIDRLKVIFVKISYFTAVSPTLVGVREFVHVMY